MRATPEKVLRRVRGVIGTGGNERSTVAVTRNPKGGTELDRAEDLFHRLVYDNGADVPTPLVLARTGGGVMSSPTPPSGLGPLNSAPVSLYPPFARPGGWDRYPTQAERYIALLTALDGVDVGSHDVRVLHWLAGWNPPTVATVCALLHRAHGAGYREGNTRSCPPPTPPPPHPPRGRPWWIPRP